jgi:hypothetical protein
MRRHACPGGRRHESARNIIKQATEKRPLNDVLLATGRGLVDAAKAVSDPVAPNAGAVSAVLELLGVAASV